MKWEFTQSDLAQFAERGVSAAQVEGQLLQIAQGYPRTQVTSAAVVGGGVRQLTEDEINSASARYDEYRGKVAKFVPASGAATRMFKKQYEYLQGKCRDEDDHPINPFEDSVELYPFAKVLRDTLLERGEDLDALQRKGDYATILHALLDPGALNYGAKPKALIPFHLYADGSVRLAFEEHLSEAASYARCASGEAHLHFTLDGRFHAELLADFRGVQPQFEKEYGTRFVLHLSEQQHRTDTIAANPDNTPFRRSDGSLLFRPAGHGALLENLQNVDADLIFIKNIDNVLPDRLKGVTIRYKKALAGVLLSLRSQIAEYLETLFSPEAVDGAKCKEMIDFCRRELSYRFPVGMHEAPLDLQLRYLRKKLNRPLRVCGVVRNEGEPGGGPYWVRERDGSESLQIVETSQMDLTDSRVQEVVSKADYFNPVDLVCSINDYRGARFNLSSFVNKNTGFVASKSVDGAPIKALELPGLWNGGMAEWNTVLVEVPGITFSPVKEMVDLLRAEHLTRE